MLVRRFLNHAPQPPALVRFHLACSRHWLLQGAGGCLQVACILEASSFLEEVFVPERIPLREPLQKGVHLVCSGYRFVRGGGAGESVIGPSLVRSGQVLIEISKYSNA